MNYEKSCHSRACVAFALCVSMIFGMFLFGAGHLRAASDDAIFMGNVKIGADAADDTLVMYSMGAQKSPEGNSTVSDIAGDYEIWVEGGHTYYLYFANGAAMFDSSAQVQSPIMPGETKYINASLTPAPARTVTLKGYLTNASNSSQVVTGGHVLGMKASMGGDPDYINWTVPDVTGYYELMVIPGMAMVAVFDAPGYLPAMGPSGIPPVASAGDTLWINISLRPFNSFTVNITGHVWDSTGSLPIEGVTVTASLDGPGFSMSNVTNATGEYKVQMVDGSGNIQADLGNYVSQRIDGVDFFGNVTQDFYLHQIDARIHGFVLDANTGEPIPNATVYADISLLPPNLRQFNQTTSAADGSYDMGLCGSGWSVSGEAPGYGRQYGSANILTGEDLLHNITLVPESASIRGFVMDWSTDLPIPGATVRINGDSGGRDNSTMTDATGYYEISCIPDDYELTYIASGYMWEVSQGYVVAVGPDQIVWMNHSLDPATVTVFGTVTDAITNGPIDGAEISLASMSSHNPEFYRLITTTSSAGNYSLVAAPDNGWSVVMVLHHAYEDFQDITSIPGVATVEYNISLLPLGLNDTYTLQGYVNDSMTGIPINMASVSAAFGMFYGNSTSTDITGFYSLGLPVVEMDLTASATGHVPAELAVSPGAAGEVVWLNLSLDAHSEPPILDESIVPNASVSVHNHANISTDIVEPYLVWASCTLMKVVERTQDYIWAMEVEGYYAGQMFGVFMGDLEWSEMTPGHWWMGLSDWDTTSQDLVMLADGTGAWELWDSYSTDASNEVTGVWGAYRNASSSMFPSWGYALFNSSGTFLGMDMGGWTPDPGTRSDPTGEFWMSRTFYQLNLTDLTVMDFDTRDTVHLAAQTMSLVGPGITYPSGEYVASFSITDVAENGNYTFELMTVDNDPPVADAGPDQTEVVGVTVTLNASASTDNGQLVDYTWSIEDGTTHTLSGATVNYAFTTLGNHSVTVTVTDAAGYSHTASAWVEVLPDGAPVAVAGADKVGDEDTVVSFDGRGSHDDVAVVNYTWTIVGQGTEMYGPTPNHVFSTPGIYTVRLVVRDTAGHSSTYDEITVAVLDVTAPVANAGSDQTVSAGTVVTFQGSGSTDNVAISQFTWTFSDGTPKTITGVSATYKFTTEGDYTVTLTVVDAQGNSATDTVVIHVTAKTGANILTDYWWALALVVVVIVAAAAFMLSRKGKGPGAKTGGQEGEAPPPPPESEELQFPPPNDEEL